RVSADYRARHHFIRADTARLQQIFWNILKNAVKFTPPGGTIRVMTEEGPDHHLLIHFKDSGIGIDSEHLPRIFNAFEQGPRSVAREFGGLGLGLTITKALVESHSGTIRVASDGRGKGATFTLGFPLDAETESGLSTPAKNPPADATRSLRIMLVEDHI